MTTALSISSLDLSFLDRAALRKLYREVLGQPSDRSVLDRSAEMRAHLAAARDAAVAAENARIETEKAAAAQVEATPTTKPTRAPKWDERVSALWDLRETPEAVEVKIPVEKMLEMGLPVSATKHVAYWCQNPAGEAARGMGLLPSLRGAGKPGSFLLLRKVSAE